MRRKGLVLAYLMRLKQLCNHPSQVSGDGAYDPAQSGKFQRLRELCEELWPPEQGAPRLEPLPADHAVWEGPFRVPPGSFKLHGLQMGCKTVLVYSPEDLSCLWEQNRQDTGRGELAFRVGTNLIAYATGKELVSLIALGREDFAAVTPDQYYRISKASAKGVGFRVRDRVYPFEQFDLRFR